MTSIVPEGGRKGKASLLDAQVTNPWPLSSTPESMTSVCFPRLPSPCTFSAQGMSSGLGRGFLNVQALQKIILTQWTSMFSAARVLYSLIGAPLVNYWAYVLHNDQAPGNTDVLFFHSTLLCLENTSAGCDITVYLRKPPASHCVDGC